jgi:hypothetical protein
MTSFLKGRDDKVEATLEDFMSWSETASFPLLPNAKSGDVFRKMRQSPRLDAGVFGADFRPLRELDARNDKHHFILEPESTDGLWPVYGGGAIKLWEPDTGSYYAWADPDHIQEVLFEKRISQAGNSKSAFAVFSPRTIADKASLPCVSPRIAFRMVARATDSRTVITTLVPKNVILQHGIPYFVRNGGDLGSEAALVGVLSSLVLDWYSRRYVELNVLFYIIDALPIPAPEPNLLERIIQVAGRLASPDERFKDWAEAVGVESGPLDDDTKNAMINELDALVAKAYGLDRDDLIHIFETFHEGWDYQPRLDATLEHFDRL